MKKIAIMVALLLAGCGESTSVTKNMIAQALTECQNNLGIARIRVTYERQMVRIMHVTCANGMQKQIEWNTHDDAVTTTKKRLM